MYIEKYWYNYIGGTDDSLTLVDYLYDKGREELPLAEIFADTGLDQLNWDFHISPSLEYTDSDGREHEFYYAINLVTDLAALMLESKRSGGFNLRDLFDNEERDCFVRITTTPEEDQAIDHALAELFADPFSYDLYEMMDDENMTALARDCEAVRRELCRKDSDRNILEQCQIWSENGEYQRIIHALEAIPTEERIPEMDLELARACNNQAEPKDKKLFRKAIDLMLPHEAYFQDDFLWNFCMGYAYYYLDQDEVALQYFKKAMEAEPEDENTQTFIEACLSRLSLPQFRENFRQRTETAWKTFAEQEAQLRRIMDEDKTRERGEELVAKCSEILHLAFENVSFVMGFNGMKHELILTPAGNKVKLFELVYFQRHAPASVLEKWNILVSRQPANNIGLRSGDREITSDDIQVWVDRPDKGSIGLTVYCEKLLSLLQEDKNRAEWMLYTITDQVLGEIPAMRYMDRFDVVRECREEEPVRLSQLPQVLRDMGLNLSTDARNYLENSYVSYSMEPDEDPDADWRMDVFIGSTNCPDLINGYLDDDSGCMDDLHADGVVAGFLSYPLDSFNGADRSEKILAFRDQLAAVLIERAGEDAITLTGGATGIYNGYLDFIAWDLPTVLDTARAFFEDSGLPWANFQVFRQGVITIPLICQEDGEDQRILEGPEQILENADAFFRRQLEQWKGEFVQSAEAGESFREEEDNGKEEWNQYKE